MNWKTPPRPSLFRARGENEIVSAMSQVMASSEKTSWRGEIVLGEEEGAAVQVTNNNGGSISSHSQCTPLHSTPSCVSAAMEKTTTTATRTRDPFRDNPGSPPPPP